MGKHERNIIETAEKIIVKILNKKKINANDETNHWYDCAVAIANQILADYPDLKSAKHLGNRYDNIGDILLKLPGSELYLEIKISDTKSGKGTRANISQDALTENKLFVGRVVSWSDFRKSWQHDQWVDDELNFFKKYPKKILDKKPNFEEKARYLRDKKITKILSKIREKDRKEKIEYLNYLSRQEQNPEMLKRFYILLMLGIHKKENLFDLINRNDFFQQAKNLIIYYGNKYKTGVAARKENAGERINNLLKGSFVFKLIFPPAVTYCKVVKVDKNKKAE